MQPLSYQTTARTCWETSMVNGILFLLDEDELCRQDQLCHLYAYRALHYFVWNDVNNYYKEKHFLPVIGAIEKFTGLRVDYRRGCDVDNAVRALHFDGQVAICDVGNGEHSILLNGKHDGWFSAFDPWWYGNIRPPSVDLQFPIGDPSVNVKIREQHLLAGILDTARFESGLSYQMGDKNKKRFVTILSKI